jgi:hypothetical protein
MAATVRRSRTEEFVQLPMQTWLTAMRPILRTVLTLSVGGAAVGRQGAPCLSAALVLQEGPCDLVAREDGGRDAQFRPHVGDRCALGHTQGLYARAAVLNRPADVALGGEDRQKIQDDVLGGDERFELARQLHKQDFWAREVERMPGDGEGHVEAARADGDHACPAARRRVTVGPEERLARRGKPLQVHLVADAVAGLGEVHAVPGRERAEELVVVGVLEAELHHVVVDVVDGDVGGRFRGAHRLVFHHRHRAGDVLRQGLVDADADGRTGCEFAVLEVGIKDLVD